MRSPSFRRLPWAAFGLLFALVGGLLFPRLFFPPVQAEASDDWKRELPIPRFQPIVATSTPEAAPSTPTTPLPAYTIPPFLPTQSIRKAHPLPLQKNDEKRRDRLTSYFGLGRDFPLLLETDKPIYKPGETLWFRVVQIKRQGEKPLSVSSEIAVDFVDPRGAVQQQFKHQSNQGLAAGQLDLPQGMAGGEYTLRVRNFVLGGETFEKKVVISVYQAPRLKKKLDFVRKAYGAGDTVQATLSLHRATGAALASHPIQGVASLDGKELKRFTATTDDKGEALLEFKLPASLQTDDGLLTAMISEGGVTESISRPLPLVVQRLKVGFFPEGGRSILGQASRVYFAVRKEIDDKPFDIEGQILDQKGKIVANLQSFHDGMGRFLYTPRAKNGYRLKITKPEGIQATFSLPNALASGISIQTIDDYLSTSPTLHIIVFSDQKRTITATALQQETLLHQSRHALKRGKNLLHLPLNDQRRGIVTLTFWDQEGRPLAERLLFRHRDRGLKLEVISDKKGYQPRQTAHVKVRVVGPDGNPVPKATLGLSVVDDTVLSYADDDEPNFLAQRYLSTQLTGKIHKPNFYFDRKKPKAYEALDLVMGTHGWRSFAWEPILVELPPAHLKGTEEPKPMILGSRIVRRSSPSKGKRSIPRLPVESARMAPPSKVPRPRLAVVRRQKSRFAENAKRSADPKPTAHKPPANPAPVVAAERRREEAAADQKTVPADSPMPAPATPMHGPMGGVPYPYYQQPYYNPTRQFPTAFYPPSSAPQARTDFRETIYWNPQITTDAWGEAKVSFGLNDQITSFRVRVSGVASEGGLGLEDEAKIASSRPFFVVAKLPLEVSAGDAIALPLTLRNDSDRPLEIRVGTVISPLFQLLENPLPGVLKLAVGEAKTFFYPIRVVAQSGQGVISFSASSEGLSDQLQQDITIFPRGFPRSYAFSGVLDDKNPRTFQFQMPPDIQKAAPDGEIHLYPNPLISALQGMEAMMREPYGCFEQTSSSNYPNVMVMRYLKEHQMLKPALLRRSEQLLARGYQRLVGYETRTRGYEWFGGSPGHEALTAYGLMQFVEMKEVYPSVSQAMIQRTSDWLLSRRDGKGGFQRNRRSLDSFGHAKKAITDAYITFALAEGGRKDLNKELRWIEDAAYGSNDPYYLALVVHSILRVRGTQDKIGQSLLKKLLALQHEDGGFRGAEHSITRSSGQSLHIETTALSILAMLQAKAPFGRTLKAARWLQGQRSSYGGFGSTQSTVLALKALIAFERASRKPSSDASYRVLFGDTVLESGTFSQTQTKPIRLRGFLSKLQAGQNTLRLELNSATEVPYNLGLRYTTLEPLSDPDVSVSLQTSLDRNQAKMGETVRLSAVIANTTDQGIPMVVARLAYPGAFEAQLWQLKQMREQGKVDFYETRPREVIVYYRSMAPHAKKVLHFDLNARVTGNYVGSASSAYLYYTHEKKSYASPLLIRVRP